MATTGTFYFSYEVWQVLVKYLDGKTIASISQVCKVWNDYMEYLTYRTDMWKRICQKEIDPSFLSVMLYKLNGALDERIKWFTIYKNWCRWQCINKHPFEIDQVCFMNSDIKVKSVQLNGEYLLVGTDRSVILYYKNGVYVKSINVDSEHVVSINEIIPIVESSLKVRKGCQCQYFIAFGTTEEMESYAYYCSKDAIMFSFRADYISYNFETNSIANLHNNFIYIENIDIKDGTFKLSKRTTGRIYSEIRPIAIYLTSKQVFILEKQGNFYTMSNIRNLGFTSVIPKGWFSLSELGRCSVFSKNIVCLTDISDDRYLLIRNSCKKETHSIKCDTEFIDPSYLFLLYGNVFLLGDKTGILHFYDLKEITSSGFLGKNNSFSTIKVFSSQITNLNIAEDVGGQIIIAATDDEVSFIKWGSEAI